MKVLRMRSWNIHAPNLDQMARFYQDALGAEVTAEQTIAGVKVFRLRAGETGIGLFDAAEKHAPALGRQEAADGLGYSVYIIDPGGNRIELSKD